MIVQNQIYSYSYSHDFSNTNIIRSRIRLKFENLIVYIPLQVKISKKNSEDPVRNFHCYKFLYFGQIS